jgi:hypothetical protein
MHGIGFEMGFIKYQVFNKVPPVCGVWILKRLEDVCVDTVIDFNSIFNGFAVISVFISVGPVIWG